MRAINEKYGPATLTIINYRYDDVQDPEKTALIFIRHGVVRRFGPARKRRKTTMNEDLKHLKEKKDFGYGDAIRITGAALALMLQIYYKRIAEDTAYNMLKK